VRSAVETDLIAKDQFCAITSIPRLIEMAALSKGNRTTGEIGTTAAHEA